MAFDLKNLRAETEVQHEPQVRFSQEDDFSEIRDEVRELKVQNQTLLEQLNKLQVGGLASINSNHINRQFWKFEALSKKWFFQHDAFEWKPKIPTETIVC